MSSRHDNHNARGSHRAKRPHPVPQQPPAQYGPYLDGLFTYCLSVLCEHDAAIATLGEVLALAERQPKRRPAEPSKRRAWLYSLARWACLRELSASRRAGPQHQQLPMSEEAAHQRHRELAALAWPEAAGTSPEQREALELAVRHRLRPEEVAEVLGMDGYATRELLSVAACEVERTRAALVVVEHGNCPVVTGLAGDPQVLLGTALRRELVRHVDDCPNCRRTAERAGTAASWPGSLGWVTPAEPLTVLDAPRAAAHAAMLSSLRKRAGNAPRYDRATGFPQDHKARAVRRDRLRSKAITTTVVATVVAAPVLALWAAYRGAPPTGEAQGASPASSEEAPEELDGRPVEKAGSAQDAPSPRFTAGSRSPDVSVEVIDPGRGPRPGGWLANQRPGNAQPGPGRLTVEAQPNGDTTVITLRASGGAPVSWRASSGASWLRFSAPHGTLSPGDTVTITVSVDHGREPEGYWEARVSIAPSGAVVMIRGRGERPDPPSTPPPSPDPTPTPSEDPSTPPPSPDPTPTPTEDPSTPPPEPSPDPTPSDGGATPSG